MKSVFTHPSLKHFTSAEDRAERLARLAAAEVAAYRLAEDIRKNPARNIEKEGPEVWLKTLGPHVFTAPLADFHIEFWNWYWRVVFKRKLGIQINEDELHCVFLLGRGLGKSTTVEWAAIAEGALVKQGYVLYVSATQNLAEAHVAAIKAHLESSEVARYYPHLSKPKIGTFGNAYGWRQNFLMCESGWAIRPVGADTAVRGGRAGSLRPTLIIIDDIDDIKDSVTVIDQKIQVLSRTILGTAGKDCSVLFAQNLVHSNSIAVKILKQTIPVLSRRYLIGPIPAFRDLEIEQVLTAKGMHYRITKGTPSWIYLDQTACQRFLDTVGPEAFRAEYQNEFETIDETLIIPEYDENVHLVTWEDVKKKYGEIPGDRPVRIGIDIGATTEHPTVITYIATMEDGVKLLYRGRTYSGGVLADEIAEEILTNMPDNLEMVIVSHEAKGERDLFQKIYNLPVRIAKPSKTAGIAQIRHYMRIDGSKPCRFGRKGKGNTSFYWVVTKEQLKYAWDDDGLKRHRAEITQWRWVTVESQYGLSDAKPIKKMDDAMNSIQFIAYYWAPAIQRMEKEELPSSYRNEVIKSVPVEQRDGIVMAREAWKSLKKQQNQEESSGVVNYVQPVELSYLFNQDLEGIL